MTNRFDTSVVEFVNRLAGHSHGFDEAVGLVSGSYLLKGGAFMAAFWWAWFRPVEGAAELGRRRTYLAASLVAAFLALVVARTLGSVLPFRPRPLFAAGLDFVPPRISNTADFEGWSSLPSDHAALFFALAIGLWYAHRSLGLLAIAYATVVICLPRLYLGIHYPTDLLAGAAIGVGIGWLVARRRFQDAIGPPVLRWVERSPSSFYSAFFVVAFQIGVLLADVRRFLHVVGRIF